MLHSSTNTGLSSSDSLLPSSTNSRITVTFLFLPVASNFVNCFWLHIIHLMPYPLPRHFLWNTKTPCNSLRLAQIPVMYYLSLQMRITPTASTTLPGPSIANLCACDSAKMANINLLEVMGEVNCIHTLQPWWTRSISTCVSNYAHTQALHTYKIKCFTTSYVCS